MKVAFIIDSLQRHGAQRFLTHLAAGLSGRGYEQMIIVLNDVVAPELERTLLDANCRVARIGKCSLLLGGAGWWRLVRLLMRWEPKVAVTLLDFADTLGRPAARLARVPVLVSSIRVRNLAKPSWQRWIDRRTIGWADRVIVNSGQLVDYACLKEGATREQVVVIANGVADLRARSASLRETYRSKLEVNPETAVLGWVGRLQAQKNPSLLLRICRELRKQRPWKLIVLGDGPERHRFLAQAHQLGLSDRVLWLGDTDQVEGWLSAMDLFVHTADFEGMPNAVMEAMAMGLPVIASAVDGTRDLIADNVNGFVAPPGEPLAFAARIDEILGDRVLARRLSEQAHHDVLATFSLERMIDAHDQLFHSLVEKGWK